NTMLTEENLDQKYFKSRYILLWQFCGPSHLIFCRRDRLEKSDHVPYLSFGQFQGFHQGIRHGCQGICSFDFRLGRIHLHPTVVHVHQTGAIVKEAIVHPRVCIHNIPKRGRTELADIIRMTGDIVPSEVLVLALIVGQPYIVELFIGEILSMMAVHASCLGSEEMHTLYLLIRQHLVFAFQEAVKSTLTATDRPLKGC